MYKDGNRERSNRRNDGRQRIIRRDGEAIGGRVVIEEVVGIGDGLALEVEAAGRDVNEEEGEIGTTQPDSSALMTEREISISVSKVLAE